MSVTVDEVYDDSEWIEAEKRHGLTPDLMIKELTKCVKKRKYDNVKLSAIKTGLQMKGRLVEKHEHAVAGFNITKVVEAMKDVDQEGIEEDLNA